MNAHANTPAAPHLWAYGDNEWMSSEEIIRARFGDLPKTKSGFIRKAKRENWRTLGPQKARKRKGRGGGWEYHISCLPSAAQADWVQRQNKAVTIADLTKREVSAKKTATELATGVAAHRRRVMEARAAILRELDRRCFTDGSKIDATIAAMIAEAKAEVCERWLLDIMQTASDRTRSPVPSARSFYRWRTAYKKALVTNSDPVLALLPGTRLEKANIDTIYPWFPVFLRHWGRPQNPTIAITVEKTIASLNDDELAAMVKLGVEPNYDKARRALKSLSGTDKFILAHKGREGTLSLNARLSFKRRTFEGMDPGTIYIADGKTFDAEIAHPEHGQPFRPEITTVLDVVTRKLVGWSIDLSENTRAVADAVRKSCEQHGIPAIFYSDNGPGYSNKEFDHATLGLCARLGTTTTHSLPYNSQARGIIERINGSIWNTLAKEFDTYVGPDMDREAKLRVHKEVRRDLKTLGTSKLLTPFAEFIERVNEAVDYYNNRRHSALRIRDYDTGRMRKASPNEYWAEFETNGFEPVNLDGHMADDLFRPHVKRKTKRGEVSWLKNHYSDPELIKYDGQDVLVAYDIQDGQRVWVREIDILEGEEHPGRLICVADFWHNKTRYVPVSMEQDAKEKRHAGQLKRLKVKEDRIHDDLRAPLLLEGQKEIPINSMAPKAELLPEPVVDQVVTPIRHSPKPASRDPRNPWGNPDIDLAWKIVEAPEGTAISIGWCLTSALVGQI